MTEIPSETKKTNKWRLFGQKNLNKIVRYLLTLVLFLYLFMFGSVAIIMYQYSWFNISMPAWLIAAGIFTAMLKGIYITYLIMVLKDE